MRKRSVIAKKVACVELIGNVLERRGAAIGENHVRDSLEFAEILQHPRVVEVRFPEYSS